MKGFLSYLPLIVVIGFIGYIFFKELIIIAVVLLIICFRREIAGLCALAQIIAVVVGIPCLFFTDSQARNSMLTLALFFGGIFLFVHLLEKNEKSKENKENIKIDSAQLESEQVPRLEKNNQTIDVRSNYNDSIVRSNNSSCCETVGQLVEVSSELYRVDELQSRFEKWLIAVENARAENRWKYGRDYERYVGYLFEREGFSVIYNGATKGSSDGGIDLFCFKDGIVYPIQCKRWKNKIDEEDFHYHKGLPLEDKTKSSTESDLYWRNKNNYLPVCFHSGYWEYVEIKSCKIIYRNDTECSFSAKFIGVMNNTPPKVIKTGETRFRQRKNNNNLPEFYDDEEKLWVTLPKSRKMLQSECMVEYYNAIRPFQNNMFRIVYCQLFKCEYIDPR